MLAPMQMAINWLQGSESWNHPWWAEIVKVVERKWNGETDLSGIIPAIPLTT